MLSATHALTHHVNMSHQTSWHTTTGNYNRQKPWGSCQHTASEDASQKSSSQREQSCQDSILCVLWILPRQALLSWWGGATPEGAAAWTHSVMTDSLQHLMRALVGKPWRANTHLDHAVWFLNSARFGIKLSYTGNCVDEERSTC